MANNVVVLRRDQTEGDPFRMAGEVLFTYFPTGTRTIADRAELQIREKDEQGDFSDWLDTAFTLNDNVTNRHKTIELAYGVEYRFAVATAGGTVKMYSRLQGIFRPSGGWR